MVLVEMWILCAGADSAYEGLDAVPWGGYFVEHLDWRGCDLREQNNPAINHGSATCWTDLFSIACVISSSANGYDLSSWFTSKPSKVTGVVCKRSDLHARKSHTHITIYVL